MTTIKIALGGAGFILFLERRYYYLNKEIKIYDVGNVDFPVCCINDAEMHFVHYDTNEWSKIVWNKRKTRIVRNNLFIVATDNDRMNTSEMFERFDKFNYINKIMFIAINIFDTRVQFKCRSLNIEKMLEL